MFKMIKDGPRAAEICKHSTAILESVPGNDVLVALLALSSANCSAIHAAKDHAASNVNSMDAHRLSLALEHARAALDMLKAIDSDHHPESYETCPVAGGRG